MSCNLQFTVSRTSRVSGDGRLRRSTQHSIAISEISREISDPESEETSASKVHWKRAEEWGSVGRKAAATRR